MKKILCVLGLVSISVHAQYGKPNIILMMADDMGWGDTHYNGNKIIITPNLDSMAEASVNFTRFHAQSAVCSPTRGSVMTGRHPERYGITTANDGRLEPEELTIAEVLRTQGYVTGHFGKWHLGTLNHDAKFTDGRRGGSRSGAQAAYSPPWDNGFDSCFSTEVQMPTWDPMEDQNYPSKYWTGPGKYATTNLQGDDSRVIMDRAIPFMESAAKANKPFLMVIWFHTPHKPFKAGPPYLAMYKDAALGSEAKQYYGAITAMDEQIGRLRAKIKELGLDNTFLSFTSDNGPEVGTPGQALGLKGRKHDYYEGGIRVPGLVEWPAVIGKGFRSKYIAVSSDYYPTILDILNLEVVSGQPLPVDGTSFLGALLGKDTVRTQPIAFFVDGGGDKFSAIIHGDKKLIKEGTGDWKFYDLEADSGESTDEVANPKYKSMVDSMKAMAAPMLSQLVFTKDGEYPTEEVVVQPDGSTALRRAPIRHMLAKPVFDGVYNVKGQSLQKLQKRGGGVLSRQGGNTYLIRRRSEK